MSQPTPPGGAAGAHRAVEIPIVCRKLRTKTAYGAGSEGALWKLGDSTTAAYWCLSTMEPFGPDDGYCHPHRCGQGRPCYQPPDEALPAHLPPRLA